MTRNLAIALAMGLVGLIVAGSTSAAADVNVKSAVLQNDGTSPPATSLLSTKVSQSTTVTPVHWGRYYAYRPYVRPYYAYRPYYRPYVRPYYRPYVAPYYAPYGAYYGGPVYW